LHCPSGFARQLQFGAQSLPLAPRISRIDENFMLSFLPAPLRGTLAALLQARNTLF
jgi:hypothetical protein